MDRSILIESFNNDFFRYTKRALKFKLSKSYNMIAHREIGACDQIERPVIE